MELKQVVLFVKEIGPMAAFYRDVLGLTPLPEESGDGWIALRAGAARLVLHSIPPSVAETFVIGSPPQPREETPIKLVFAVKDVAVERARLISLGVSMFDLRPWGACDGVDPEGNVFQLAR